ncbi:MAG TPA: SRPBCC family protein [Acidimicrobiia bacterium]
MPSIDTSATIRKTITVDAPRERAFEVFTAGHGKWWPAQYHIGTSEFETAVIEPGEGGRWYERGADGTECNWGRVLVWDPPDRLVLAWQISAAWQFDAELVTEVEVRFVAESPQRTRVELEHRHLDRYREQADAMRSTFDAPQGWSGILEQYAAATRS